MPPPPSEPWTLDRVAREMPDRAPLARLHLAIESCLQTFDDDRALTPQVAGTPGVHWLEGTPLLDAAARAALVARLPTVLDAILAAVADAEPAARSYVDEVRAAPVDWDPALASFRDPAWLPPTPHAPLARFLVLRAISLPARRLGRAFSAPHPDRWKRSRCPFCGVEAAACVARAGSGRTLLCVLCGGRWETTDTICTGCGERNLAKFGVLASRDAGPASLETCRTCGTAVKVFSPQDVTWGPPVALEVATVRLDLLAERDEGTSRDAVALSCVFPPE